MNGRVIPGAEMSTFRLTNVIPERIIFVSQGITVCSFIRNNVGLWFYFVCLFVHMCVCERENMTRHGACVYAPMNLSHFLCACLWGCLFISTSVYWRNFSEIWYKFHLVKFINLCKILHIPMDGESKQKWKWEVVVLTVGVCVGR